VQEIGPQLGLDHDQQARPQSRQAAADAARQIIGRKAHLHSGQQRTRPGPAGRRRAGQRDLQIRRALAQRGDQDGRNLHLADRHRMHPDATALTHRAETEARRAAAPILARAYRTPQQQQHCKRQRQV